jgi:hypothetical protein
MNTNLIEKFKTLLFADDLNKWFKYLNLIILIPSLAWPYVLFVLIFFFDNPTNYFETWLIILGVVFYPFYLLIICILNVRLFRINKLLGYILPSIMVIPTLIAVLFLSLIIIVNGFGDNLKELMNFTDLYEFIFDKIYR